MSDLTIRPDFRVSMPVEGGSSEEVSSLASFAPALSSVASEMSEHGVSLRFADGQTLGASEVDELARLLARGDEVGAQALLDRSLPGLGVGVANLAAFLDDVGAAIPSATADNPGATSLRISVSRSAFANLGLGGADGDYRSGSAATLDVLATGGSARASAPDTRSGSSGRGGPTTDVPRGWLIPSPTTGSLPGTSADWAPLDRALPRPSHLRDGGLDDFEGLSEDVVRRMLSSPAFMRSVEGASDEEVRGIIRDVITHHYRDLSPALTHAELLSLSETTYRTFREGTAAMLDDRVRHAAADAMDHASRDLRGLARDEAAMHTLIESLSGMSGDDLRHMLQGLNLEGVDLRHPDYEDIAARLQERATDLRDGSAELREGGGSLTDLRGAFAIVRDELSVPDHRFFDGVLEESFHAEEASEAMWHGIYVAGSIAATVAAGAVTGGAAAPIVASFVAAGFGAYNVGHAMEERDAARVRVAAGVDTADAADLADAHLDDVRVEATVSVLFAGVGTAGGHALGHSLHLASGVVPSSEFLLHGLVETGLASYLHDHSSGELSTPVTEIVARYGAARSALDGLGAERCGAILGALDQVYASEHIDDAEERAALFTAFLISQGGGIGGLDRAAAHDAFAELVHRAREAGHGGGH